MALCIDTGYSFLYDLRSSRCELQQFATVDRKIPNLKDFAFRIEDLVSKDQVESLRIRHIQLATQELADECKVLLSSGAAEFSSLASTLSTCSISKENGGDLGWQSIEKMTDQDSLSSMIPVELLNAALHLGKNDITVISSSSFDTLANTQTTKWHVLQVTDIINRLSPVLLQRRKLTFAMSRATSNQPDNTTPMTYSIDTMGCQMNIADSERMEAQLVESGYTRTSDSLDASVVILNTCSIRDHAEQKVYSYLGPHALRKRRGEDVSIIVAGCVAQQEGASIIQRFPEVDAVMGPQYANRLTDLLKSIYEGHQLVATDPAFQSEDSIPALRKSDVTAFVSIIFGCNERCTYCVVPNTRGVEQSRSKEAILAEMQDLAKHGYREITLLGQNIDSWGRDMNPKQKFADLLAAAAQVPGIKRVRFLTSHPKYMSRRVIDVMAKYNETLMPCFNIPFQAGDNEILRNMRRGYTVERYLEIITNIRSALPDAAIVADCIVGFPGETEEQFQATLDLMEKVQFETINTAAYSPRPGTPAADWGDQVPDAVKQDRLQRINRLAAVHAMSRSQRFVGRIEEILVEEINPKNVTQVVGRNRHSRLVYFAGNFAELKGKMIMVKIIEAKAYSLVGEMVADYEPY